MLNKLFRSKGKSSTALLSVTGLYERPPPLVFLSFACIVAYVVFT